MIIGSLLGAILLVSLPASRGLASDTTILIQPSSSEVDVDDTVTVDIRIEDVTALYGVDVRLSFEPTLLEVVQIQAGSFPAPNFVVKKEADNSAGTAWYAVSPLVTS